MKRRFVHLSQLITSICESTGEAKVATCEPSKSHRKGRNRSGTNLFGAFRTHLHLHIHLYYYASLWFARPTHLLLRRLKETGNRGQSKRGRRRNRGRRRETDTEGEREGGKEGSRIHGLGGETRRNARSEKIFDFLLFLVFTILWPPSPSQGLPWNSTT